MAPGLVEDLPVSSSNGKGATAEHAADPAASTKGKYNAIPGPLGLASASLEGKVALVTGAGKHFLCYLFSSEFFWDGSQEHVLLVHRISLARYVLYFGPGCQTCAPHF